MPKEQILVVEDESITAKDIETILVDIGYKVVNVVSSGNEAMEQLRKTKADLVLMDIHIEGTIDGVETAKQIKHNFDIPIIYITAHADDETIQRAKITEPYGYIVKPFEDIELKTVIEVSLYKHKKIKKDDMKLIKEKEEVIDRKSKGIFSSRQLQIINTAMDIISEKGIQQLTIKKIADKLNISDAAIYKHFKGRSELLSGIINVIEEFFKESFDKVHKSKKSPLMRLRILFLEWMDKYSTNQSLIPITLSEDILKGEKNLDRNIYDILRKRQNLIIDVVTEGQKIGEIKNSIKPTHISIIITGALTSLAYEWHNRELKFDLNKEGLEVWEVISNMLEKKY